MALGLQKSVILYLRRVARLAAPVPEEQLNLQDVPEYPIPASQQFDPTFFPGFLEDPPPPGP